MEKKNIYKITFKEVNWDEMAGFVVVANSKKEAKEICGISKEHKTFSSQYESNIKEFILIGICNYKTKKGIVLRDFNAG